MQNFDANEFEETDDSLNPSHSTNISSPVEKEDDYDSLEHVRSKMSAMDAEAQKIMAMSRQVNEKATKESTNDTNGTNESDANKAKATSQSSNNLSAQTQFNPNKPDTDYSANNSLGDSTIESTLSQQKEDQKALDERSVFIKNIDEKVEVDELKQYFESCGAIERVTILANKYTGQPKGCAYVQFKSKVAVANALLLNGKTWQGKVIEVQKKRTNLPPWMFERGRGRARGFRGTFRGRGRAFAYVGYRGGYRGRGYWQPYGPY